MFRRADWTLGSTHRAPVRPLARVQPLVRLERNGRAERLGAVAALTRLLARVRELVLPQLLHRNERPAAVLTPVENSRGSPFLSSNTTDTSDNTQVRFNNEHWLCGCEHHTPLQCVFCRTFSSETTECTLTKQEQRPVCTRAESTPAPD